MELKASAVQPSGLQLFPFKNGTMGGFENGTMRGFKTSAYAIPGGAREVGIGIPDSSVACAGGFGFFTSFGF